MSLRLVEDEGLLDFIPRISSDRRAPLHLAKWCSLIERALTSPVRGLCSYPIQHWKTETTMHGVVWLLTKNPKLHIIVLTYSKERAEWWGKHCRRIAEMTSIGPARGFNKLTEWENEQGGGVTVMSAEQSKLGYPCDVLIADDPIDEHQAKDKKIRTLVDEAITHYHARAIISGTGAILLVMSRWHLEDPYGLRQMRPDEAWEEYHHPAIIDRYLTTERAWAPDVCSLSTIYKAYQICHNTDPSDRLFEAQLMCNPLPDSLSYFREPQRYAELPTWPGFIDALGFDMSFTKTKRSDWSAIVALRIYPGHRSFIKEVVRFRADIGQAKIEVLAALQRHPGSIIYSFMSGPEIGVARLFAAEGIPIQAKHTQDTKLVRVQRAMAAWNVGEVLVPADAPWVSGVVRRFKMFTGDEAGGDDDEVDAYASVFECAVYGGGGGAVPMMVGARRA